MKLYLWAAVILILVSPIMAEEGKNDTVKKLTLADSISLALTSNRQILQARETLTGTNEKISEYKSYLYPQVQVDANYTRLGRVPEYMGFQLAAQDNYSYKGSVAQLIYAWGKVDKGIALSEAEVTMVKGAIVLTEREISYAVVQIFYQMLTLQESLKIIDDNIGLLEKQLEMLKAKYERGEASDFDVLSTEVQISLAKGQRLDAQNGLAKIRLQFNLIIGRPVETPVELAGALEYQAVVMDEKVYLDEALVNRAEMRQLQTRERIVRLQKDLAATGNKPMLNAFGSWALSNGNQPNINAYVGAWTFGAMLSFPLFDGGRTGAQVRQAQSGLNSLRLEYEQQSQSIAAEVRQSLLDIQSARQKIEINKLAAAQAEKALAIAEQRYEKGLVDTLELLTSRSTLAGARLNLLQSVYNFNVSKYSLERAAGRAIVANKQ